MPQAAAAARQLTLCTQLYQAALACREQCEKLVPASFNAALLEGLQHLMLCAVQQQEEQLQGVRACLEAALQLLSRVGSLGPIEAFFVADELLAHYQNRVEVTHSLLSRLGGETCHCTARQAAAAQQQAAGGGACSCSKCQLEVPDQQQHIVSSFRLQAAKLCPMLVQTCPAEQLQQLFDTVRQGLVLVNGHSFLISQEWQAEVSAMLARAEQLKVVLAHKQAHHLALLASVLQHLHQQEVQAYDQPVGATSTSSPNRRPHSGMSAVQHGVGQSLGGGAQQQAAQQQVVTAGGLAAVMQQQQQQQAAAILQNDFQSMCLNTTACLDDDNSDDEFFMPVAPLEASASGSPDGSPGTAAAAAAAATLPALPFHTATAAQAGSSGLTSDGDSLARTPSSGCSSLLEYVHNSMATPRAVAAVTGADSPTAAAMQHMQSLHSVEQQLMSIAGSAEVAAVLATALGYEQLPRSQASSTFGGSPSAGGASISFSMPGSFPFMEGSGLSSPGHSRPASVLGRLSSSAVKALEGLAADRASSSSMGGAPARQQQQQRRRWQRPRKASSTLCLQHVQLPPGCCRSIGAVCYVCQHLQRIVLIDVGLDDHDVGDLVDALKVNSSIKHLDLSHNAVQDIGARVLALLLKPCAGTGSSSSSLRTLCLQHNEIGDDGAAALAGGLASSTKLQRLWLQHNAIGEAGASALCRAMRHNMACIDLKLHPGNEVVPPQLAQAAAQLARQNRGALDHMKGLLKLVVVQQ